jgi:hypothetical protein
MLMEKTIRKLRKAKVTIGLVTRDTRFVCLQPGGSPEKEFAAQRAERACEAGRRIPRSLVGHGGRNAFALDQQIS